MESKDPTKAAEQDVTTRPAATRVATGEASGWGSAVNARRRASAEGATLICAVVVAVALGVACGAWVNARLASASARAKHAPAKLLTPTVTAEQPTPAAASVVEQAPTSDDTATFSLVEAAPPPEPIEPPVAVAHSKDSTGAPRKEGASKGDGVSRPIVTEPRRPGDTAARVGEAPDNRRKATAAPGTPAPCALYASAASLNIRGAAAAPLVVGGPGENGRVSVTTPDWADIAVFNEGRAGGNGWLRFSVRSVSRRPGVYTVRLTTSCGSRNIPVKVTQP